MKITFDMIDRFRPCEDRRANFIEHYGVGWRGSLEEFLSLENITYLDKRWVCIRLMSRQQKVEFATACALSVLDVFETRYPNDKRLRKLLEFLCNEKVAELDKLTVLDLASTRKLRADVSASASAAAASAAAYSAAYAAASAADAALYAYSAAFAATHTAYAADSAAAASAASASMLQQEELTLLFAYMVLTKGESK